jgi:outer membrane protein assembly factor BamB
MGTRLPGWRRLWDMPQIHRIVLLTLCVCAGSLLRSQQPAAVTWPQFRGTAAAGVADGLKLPETWDGTGTNLRWKVKVPGLSHASPIVWGDRIYVTSAISSRADATFTPGLYGAGTGSEDKTPHKWMVYAVDRATGKVVWERVAHEGVPRETRHIKSTYASATPATDGRVIVAWFGSHGLHAFDMDGTPLWSRDLGRLDVGAYNAPEIEWGVASSPIIDEGRVFVQADQQKGSFVAAFDVMTGKELWRVQRDLLSSWATPAVYRSSRPGGRTELVTNAPRLVIGYDPATGKELWRSGGSSMITTPTPVYTDDLIIVASGRAPERPIFGIRPGATGDITPGTPGGDKALAWYKTGRGSYMPTPLIYDGRLYVLSNQGLLDAYDLSSGADVYRERLNHQGSGFSASPVAADGRIYLSSEDGEVFVVRAGPTFEILATNVMGEPLMATPALADGTMYIRGQHHLFAVGAR